MHEMEYRFIDGEREVCVTTSRTGSFLSGFLLWSTEYSARPVGWADIYRTSRTRLTDPSATGAAKAQGNFKRRCLDCGELALFFYGVFAARFAREGLQGPHPPGIRVPDPEARRHAGAVTE